MSNDVATLDALFHDDARTIRYGGAENLYGYDEIKAFRAARSPAGLARTLSKTVITHLWPRLRGRVDAVSPRRSTPGKVGRQMQTWVRFAEGWRIVAAHVSAIDEPTIKLHAPSGRPVASWKLPADRGQRRVFACRREQRDAEGVPSARIAAGTASPHRSSRLTKFV